MMQAEDIRSRSINLTYVNQEKVEEIQILTSFSKKLEKKLRKLQNEMNTAKEVISQLKDIKKEVSPQFKKWKEIALSHATPLDMVEGNMLHMALYLVFVVKFTAREGEYLRIKLSI